MIALCSQCSLALRTTKELRNVCIPAKLRPYCVTQSNYPRISVIPMLFQSPHGSLVDGILLCYSL